MRVAAAAVASDVPSWRTAVVLVRVAVALE